MIYRLPFIAMLALASLPAASIAAPTASRNYGVSGFDRIRVDGPYEVHLTTGVPPFAKASGNSAAALDEVSIQVEGRTLVIRKGSGGWGGNPDEARGPVTIDVGTHELSAAWLNGAGRLDINAVKGLSFDLNVQGSGAARIDAVAVDQLKVGITGAASVRLAGSAPSVTTVVRGTSSFDGEQLQSKDVVVGAEGPSIIRMNASNSAKVDAIGLPSISFTGRPACTVKAQGSATVTGCK